MSIMQEAGKRIALLRYRKGLTQEQLGQQLNVSGQAVSKWENGDSLPDTKLLVHLARTLECTIDHLLGADRNGGINRLLPTIEAEMRGMAPSQRMDMAFRMCHMIDEASYAHVKSARTEKDVFEQDLPFVHAGPEGITVWWKGKLHCSVTVEALKETESIWKDGHLPFDLFPAQWNALLPVLLSQKNYFNANVPIAAAAPQEDDSIKDHAASTVGEWMNAGLLEQVRGGYKMGIQAEVLLRLLAVHLHAVGKPGCISHTSA
ncbi:helix-turn-helix domain-containing protein [Paenibacillus mendelii]|uniref:Helix-turn-helix domain-containing protein n=1 Tax=Paenibacillus mendelii TaxID=206163 RepID=A0ABV6J7R9_9BACL|nr:helix-turn-helix transcriptional regulator [Paenibacillus mendelii]MCQ6561407.1 helix-turn-helix domain-containing protein [Paenibacillus mendelii]